MNEKKLREILEKLHKDSADNKYLYWPANVKEALQAILKLVEEETKILKDNCQLFIDMYGAAETAVKLSESTLQSYKQELENLKEEYQKLTPLITGNEDLTEQLESYKQVSEELYKALEPLSGTKEFIENHLEEICNNTAQAILNYKKLRSK